MSFKGQRKYSYISVAYFVRKPYAFYKRNTQMIKPKEPIQHINTENEGLSVALKHSKLKRFFGSKRGKITTIVSSIVIVLVVIFAIPITRYTILGAFIKKDVMITVVDSATKKPVTDADVTLGTLNTKTDNNGMAHLSRVPVGNYDVSVAKNYYESSTMRYIVPIFAAPQDTSIELKATGRQVMVSVTNTITHDPVAKAAIKTHDTSAVTDAQGKATMVLPADQETVKATMSSEEYNQTEVTIKVTDQDDANKFSLTPNGEVFFLSKQTGKINVMKTNLDGSNPQVVVAGTGNEDDRETVLLAARDWRYMTLSTDRAGDGSRELYLVDGESGDLTLIDEGANTGFQPVGWSDHTFSYIVTRYDKVSWENGYQALKVYNAETKQLSTLDETRGVGDHEVVAQSEYIGTPYILEGKLVYAKYWSLSNGIFLPSDKKSSIVVVNMHNLQKQTVKEFSMNHLISLQAKLYEPQEVYFRVAVDGGQPTFYEYEGGSLKTVTNTDDKFFNTFYPTYLVSPSGEKTFWFEPRDGKNALFVGDKNGDNSTELTLQSDYVAYGWFTDDYILLSKNGSELYIAPSDSLANEPVKISNYHKPQLSFPGYGYGYGGQ